MPNWVCPRCPYILLTAPVTSPIPVHFFNMDSFHLKFKQAETKPLEVFLDQVVERQQLGLSFWWSRNSWIGSSIKQP